MPTIPDRIPAHWGEVYGAALLIVFMVVWGVYDVRRRRRQRDR